jgi:DNA-binding CsgD family transcriptional regulator
MGTLNIQQTYSEIFKSHGSPTLEEHVKKIIELDQYLPHSSTFYCITNTQDLSFEYISENLSRCLKLDKLEFERQGMRYFWSRIHPDDLPVWLNALNELMEFTLSEIPIVARQFMSYSWNYRFLDGNNTYVNIIQNTTPLQYDSNYKPIIGLAHYTVLDGAMKLEVCATAKFLNAHNEYETKYFNNFSQKLLSDGITNRERDVIRLLLLNYSSKKIAEKLNISAHTVDTHRRNILKKMKVSTTGELIGMLKVNMNLV